MRKFHNLIFWQGGDTLIIEYFGGQIAQHFAGIVVNPIFYALHLLSGDVGKTRTFRETTANHSVQIFV